MKSNRNWVRIGAVYILILAGLVAGAFAGSRAVTTMVQMNRQTMRHTLVIDPGHGGEDGGATSCTGVLESQINLEISLRLQDLAQLLGYDTKMIRTTDRAVYTQGDTLAQKKMSDLKNRVKICNETPNALLVSVHQNQFSESRYSGAQVFFPPENETARQLASVMQQVLVQTVNAGSKRQCKKADGVYLMEHIQCPGILIECGFLSNPEEEARLRSAEYQKKLCCVIGTVVAAYFAAE